jgi:flagellar motility protein MotE (MotC chaperone)
MSRKGTARRGTAPLVAVAALLGLSGLLRLGDAGTAVALELSETPASVSGEGDDAGVAAGLAALRERNAELDRREAALEERLRTLMAAEETVAAQLSSLREAEDRLRSLMTLAEESAENDLVQLTAVYENMKPKEASLLFERMSPEFAAGFLGRMRPDAAAAILSGLPPELGYSISVLLAGRNADAAAFAAGN